MISPAHTPTPWVVKRMGQHWNDSKLEDIAVCHGEDGEHVCDTVYEIADAYLIAAAPELLKELKELVDSEVLISHSVDIARINDLIAKAEGRAV